VRPSVWRPIQLCAISSHRHVPWRRSTYRLALMYLPTGARKIIDTRQSGRANRRSSPPAAFRPEIDRPGLYAADRFSSIDDQRNTGVHGLVTSIKTSYYTSPGAIVRTCTPRICRYLLRRVRVWSGSTGNVRAVNQCCHAEIDRVWSRDGHVNGMYTDLT